MRAQSAMEYLMTYGWAILIIAIVLVALFSLGVFNSANFAPRAQPGSCQVIRTAAQVSLAGQCNGMLPEYVAEFNGADTTNILITASFPTQPISATAWIYLNQTINNNDAVIFSNGQYDWASGISWQLAICSMYVCAETPNVNTGSISSSEQISPNAWTFVAVTIYPSGTGSEYSFYSNKNSQTLSYNSPDANTQGLSYIGTGFYNNPMVQFEEFPGKISNIQIYNTSLSANDVQALYQEGIGGAPIKINNLVGWWPLNGNANDYSGNGNDGTATNVIYTSAWTSGYSTP